MDFLKSSKRRSFLSEIIYILLNVGLAISILIVVLLIESPIAALVLVLLSKWRILAVRPQYWTANIQANLVDIMVGFSFIVLLYAASSVLLTQIILTALYVGWLLFIKPSSKRLLINIQAGVAIFLGTTALLLVSYNWYASVVVSLLWIIGYSTARHVLSNHDETHMSFYSLLFGLIFAELGWLMSHWAFAYEIPGLGDIKLSQSAIILFAVGFIAEKIYSSYNKHGSIKINEIILPVITAVSIIMMLLIFFNKIGIGSL